MPDLQAIFNWVGFALLSVVGYFAKKADMRSDKTADDLVSFRLEVAKDYVTHADMRRIEDTLIRIEAKLDAKADK